LRIAILVFVIVILVLPPFLMWLKRTPLLTSLQVQFLRKAFPGKPGDGPVSERGLQLTKLFGDDFLARIEGKCVTDFGCGEGSDAVQMAQHGAAKVIGLDIREDVLRIARQKASDAGVQAVCRFTSSAEELADVVVSVDAFEHFEDPEQILRIMSTLLKPTGEVHISFGPPWYHPLGGHLFSVFPWAHLIFSEKALCLWRSDFKTDGATRFSEVAGGLNQMSIARFERLVARSPLELAALEIVPIRKLRPLHNRLTQEFTTAVVRCRLKKRA
jgi:SAM-dependent methyltransferase